jgi:hypothetical protein
MQQTLIEEFPVMSSAINIDSEDNIEGLEVSGLTAVKNFRLQEQDKAKMQVIKDLYPRMKDTDILVVALNLLYDHIVDKAPEKLSKPYSVKRKKKLVDSENMKYTNICIISPVPTVFQRKKD